MLLKFNKNIKNSVKKLNHKFESIHSRKLASLGYNPIKHPPSECVISNFSNRVLSSDEEEALSVGLNFVLTPKKFSLVNHFLPFEKLLFTLNKTEFYNKTKERESRFKSELKNIAHSSFSRIKNFKLNSNLPKSQIDALKNLSNDKSIVIIKPDKGNGVVVLNKCDYVEKVEGLLLDDSKFKKINKNVNKLMFSLEDKITRFLRLLKSKNIIDDETFKNLQPSGSKPGILYGLPKIHKPGCPIRPILSAIKTPTYNLAKFIIPLINPWSSNEFTTKDSFHFTAEIIKYDNSSNLVMASFDIKSLFTNVPLKDTIEVILNLAFRDSDKFLVLVNNFSKNF